MNDPASRRPPELSAGSRQLLTLNRRLHDIPEAVFERGLQRCAALQQQRTSTRVRRLATSIGVAVAVAAAVLLAVLAPRMLAETAADQAAPQAPYDRQPEQPVQPSERPSAHGVAREPDPPPPPATAEAVMPAHAPPDPPAPPRKARPPEPAIDGLEHEQAVLARAAKALAEGRHADARTQLDDHARRFADGKLATEREALRMILRCSLNERDAQVAAARFVERHPEALMVAKVRARCGLAP